MTHREELVRNSIADMIYARVGWSNASEGASVDIAHFILQREKALLDEIERPLKECYRQKTPNGFTFVAYKAIDEALQTIARLRKEVEVVK